MKGWFAPRDKHLFEQEELEVKNAKYLLIRMRNEETNLRKSAFEREKKGFDEYLFEEDSEQHRVTLLREQQKLKRNIEAMNTQYKQQLEYRDTHLQDIIEGDFEQKAAKNDGYIKMTNKDLDNIKREYDAARDTRKLRPENARRAQ